MIVQIEVNDSLANEIIEIARKPRPNEKKAQITLRGIWTDEELVRATVMAYLIIHNEIFRKEIENLI